ncbi:MAG: glutamate--tRNA ligase family protein, partial [Bacteroidota bacterium]|nr:glutamate--tRNA ligase family protein [Bacteroidota bacterium]
MENDTNAVSFHKTRIAPTPSGYLHLGNALSFIITAALAKKANSKLLLRIDDLDRGRTQKKYVEDIFETLHFLGIEWAEGPKDYNEYEQVYSQTHRMHLYQTALQQLKNDKKVYACACSRLQLTSAQVCFCMKKNIPLDTPGVSWRLITDAAQLLTINTAKQKVISTLPSAMQGFIVRNKSGFPSYQLSSLIDDEHFGIDAIVRGEDLWDSSLAQQY